MWRCVRDGNDLVSHVMRETREECEKGRVEIPREKREKGESLTALVK